MNSFIDSITKILNEKKKEGELDVEFLKEVFTVQHTPFKSYYEDQDILKNNVDYLVEFDSLPLGSLFLATPQYDLSEHNYRIAVDPAVVYMKIDNSEIFNIAKIATNRRNTGANDLYKGKMISFFTMDPLVGRKVFVLHKHFPKLSPKQFELLVANDIVLPVVWPYHIDLVKASKESLKEYRKILHTGQINFRHVYISKERILIATE